MADVIEIVITATDKASGVFESVGANLRTIGTMALGVAAVGIGVFAAALSDSIGLAQTQADAEEQLAAVLESTGHAAGMSADELKDLAASLQDVTNFTDEAIISGENILLTFTNIGEDVFPRTTETMLDMSQALGQDLKSSAMQLGKALNDPIAGFTQLGRVGVTFTEEQIAAGEAMVAVGDIAGAQAIILDELAKEFGGSARALADPVEQLGNTWQTFKETIGAAVLPVIENLASAALPVLKSAIEAIGLPLDYVRQALLALAQGNTQAFFDRMRVAVFGFGQAFGIPIESIRQFVAGIEGVGQKIGETIVQIQPFIDQILAVVDPVVQAAVGFVSLQDVLIALGVAIVAAVLPAVVALVTSLAPIVLTFAAIVAAVALVRQVWENDFLGIRTALEQFWVGTAQPIFEQLVLWFQVNLPIALEFLTNIWNTVLLPALQNFGIWLTTVLLPLFQQLIDWLQVNIPIALQFLTDVWNNVLLPAITAVSEYINTYVIPFWTALADLLNSAVTLALRAITGIWQNELQPALQLVWEWIGDKIMPVFDSLSEKVNGPVSNALTSFKGWIDGLFSSLGGLAGVFQDVIGWIEDMIAALDSAVLPDWMTPGSPTPWETGLRGVSDAFRELNTSSLPAFKQGMQQVGAISTKSTNLTLNLYSSAKQEQLMGDFNLMKSLAGGV